MFISFIKTYKNILILIIIIIILLYLLYYNYETFFGSVVFNTDSWPRRLSTYGLTLEEQKAALNYCGTAMNTQNLVDKCPLSYPNPANFYFLSCLKEIAVSSEVDAGLASVFAFGSSCKDQHNLDINPARVLCRPELDSIYIGTNCWEICTADQIGREYYIVDSSGLRKKYQCLLKLTNTNIQNAVDLWTSNEIESSKLYGPISLWDVSNVTNMNNLFKNKMTFNQNTYDLFFNESYIMSRISNGVTIFNQDISQWNVSNVTTMIGMFQGATSFNQDISRWNISNVTDMSNMFNGATNFDKNISIWNISNVTTMSGMFQGATSFNQDISQWNVSNVTSMSNMFNSATSFNQDISQWNVSNVTDMSIMFYNSKLITDIIINNKLYNTWINYTNINKLKLNGAYLFYNTIYDCVGAFTPFSECSKTCGGGIQTKTYTITTPAQYNGTACPNLNGDIQTQACNTQPCPINCSGEFGPFSECSKTCGGGIQTKTYKITTPAQYNGTACPNLNGDIQTQACNTQPCPINCSGEFGPFSQCSKTCGGGTQTKTYKITTPAQYNGAACPNLNGDIQTQACNTQPCPNDCVGAFTPFSECSKTCGGGTQTKTYKITTPAQYNGAACPNLNGDIQTQSCNTQPCPINCVGKFVSITQCSQECGGGKETIKYTILQEAQHGGAPCEYTDGYTDRIDCNVIECENKLDTLYYKSFNPLEYDKNRDYYWRRDKLVEEGIRRNQDDLKELVKVQTLLDTETDENKKKKIQDELDLFKWRDSILKQKDTNTGLSRDKTDIITDYYPEEIGLQRPWIERHSHIPDYSY